MELDLDYFDEISVINLLLNSLLSQCVYWAFQTLSFLRDKCYFLASPFCESSCNYVIRVLSVTWFN